MNIVKIEKINKVLANYFKNNKNVKKVPALELMDEFVKAGVFKSDSEKRPGLPIRNILRELDENNELHLIPYVHVERKTKNRNWFFIPI
jgi:hypothetical protein